MIPSEENDYGRKPKKEKRPKTKFQLQMARLDTYFNKFVRLSASDENGFCRCVSCGKLKPWKGAKIHAGHFINKTLKTLFVRWDLRNVNPQCYHCNWNLKGNKWEYSKYLIQKYGPDICDILKIDSTKHFNPDVFDMEAKIKFYRMECKRLEKEKGFKSKTLKFI